MLLEGRNMNFITKKKIVFTVVFCVVLFSLFILWVHRERFFISFRESTSLDFQRSGMEHIHIRSQGNLIDIDNVVISDAEKIKEIINYLNSLELVEAELPRNLRRRINNFEDVGWISIYIGESINHNPGDIVVFWANYMRFVYHGHRVSRTYYVRNSGFCNEAKTSNIYYFLRNLLNEGQGE